MRGLQGLKGLRRGLGIFGVESEDKGGVLQGFKRLWRDSDIYHFYSLVHRMQFAIKNVISFLVKAFLCMHLKSVIKNTHISSNFERKKFCLWSKLIHTCLLTYYFFTLYSSS